MTKHNHGSSVWAAFEKIAAESNLITPDLTPAQEHIENRKKDVATGDDYTRNPKTEEYGVTEGEGKDMVEKAHEEDAQVASAMGKGGLVENLVQQQEKDVEIALKMPDGTLHGVHASVVSDLVKLANSLDESGNEDAAKRVDAAIKEIRNLPFVDGHLRKEAWAFLPWLGAAAVSGLKALFTLKGAAAATATIGGLKMFGARMFSQVNNLPTDVNDMYETLKDNADNSPSAAKAAKILEPYNTKLKSVDISTEKGYNEFVGIARSLKPVLEQLGKYVVRIQADYETGLWQKARGLVGLDSPKVIAATLNDLKTSLSRTLKLIDGADSVKEKLEAASKEVLTTPLMSKIVNLSMGQELDSSTAKELEELEQKLTKELANDIRKEDGSTYDFSGKIVSGGTLVIEPKDLKKIIELAERVNR